MRSLYAIHNNHDGLYLQEDGMTWGSLEGAKLYTDKLTAHKAALEIACFEVEVLVIIRGVKK